MIENYDDFKLINESFPSIGKKLKFFWGHPEFNALMDDLQHNTREGTRKGFPANIMFALHNLDAEHGHAFPKLVRKRDMWDLGSTATSAVGKPGQGRIKSVGTSWNIFC